MAVSLTNDPIPWLQGDTPDGGKAGVVAKTVIFVNEEVRSTSPTVWQTWVRTNQGVSALFAGQQAVNIYNLIKTLTPVV